MKNLYSFEYFLYSKFGEIYSFVYICTYQFKQILNGMETKYFKKIEGVHTFYAARLPEHKGLRVMIGNGYATVDNLYCYTPGDYNEISEEEFFEAFEIAMATINENVLVAA